MCSTCWPATARTSVSQPLAKREVGLAQFLSRQVDGIFIAEYERGDIGDLGFRLARNMDLEGIVLMHLGRAHSASKCRHWIRIKNTAHSAYSRVTDALIRRELLRHLVLRAFPLTQRLYIGLVLGQLLLGRLAAARG
jgi:hypothetical protein